MGPCSSVQYFKSVNRNPQLSLLLAAMSKLVELSTVGQHNQSAEGAGGLGIIRDYKVGESE